MVDSGEPVVGPAHSQDCPAINSPRHRVWARALVGLAMLAALSACNATTTAGLHVRSAPNTSSPSVTTIATSGAPVTVTCYVYGQSVRGNRVWYRVSNPGTGYVSGYYVTNRTAGSTTQVPHC
jgi:uncharacterized protein YraI